MPKSIKLQNKDDIKKKKEFRQWLDPYSTGKYKGYDTFLLREKLCVVVKNVTNEDNIYRISDPKTVDKIKKIYIQQYSDENKNSGSGGPSAALGKYSEYLNSKKTQGINPVSIGGNNSAPQVHGRNIIFYGAPGTGKSHTVDNIIKGINEKGQEDYGLGPGKDFRTTFHPDTDYATFVGCYKPSMNNNRIEYHFTMQVFLEAYKYAWEHLGEQVYLVIEEINRGNCAQIFGDIFQLLDREPQSDGHSKYLINPDVDIIFELKNQIGKEYRENLNEVYKNSIKGKQNIEEKNKKGVLALPGNLTILATMNTSDQSLFPMDSAFKRRWEWKYIKIDYDKIKDWKLYINKQELSWKCVLKHINDYIRERKNATDKQLGEFFIMTMDGTNNVIKFEDFRDKVLFYLFNDVFKGDRSFFADENNNRRFFEDLFTGSLSENDVYNWMDNNMKISECSYSKNDDLDKESNTDKHSVGDVDALQETNNVNTEEGQ